MNQRDIDISGFEYQGNGDDSPGRDVITQLRRLNRQGSTCDTWVGVMQRRRVFVKQLKACYRLNPLYRAAFDKEFDIGVSLSHPSLPRYISFLDDSIVTDYIEGDTLADMISRQDPRLADKAFVTTILGQLVDVIDYLHHRHVIHCDIKADNIIVSPYPDRPVTLIDLDKAYTSWLDSTPGDPTRYGCDQCDDGVIDYRGLGRIARQLGMKAFATACLTQKLPTVHELRQLLSDGSHRRSRQWRWIIAVATTTAVAIIGAVTAMRESNNEHQTSSAAATPQVTTDTAVSPIKIKTRTNDITDHNQIKTPTASPVAKTRQIDDVWLTYLFRSKSGDISLRQREMLALMDNDTVPVQAVHEAVSECMVRYSSVMASVIFDAIDHYQDLPEPDVQKAVRNHREWKRLSEELKQLQLRYRDFR